jgi:hypothetical protein
MRLPGIGPHDDRSAVALKEGSAEPTPVDTVVSNAWSSQLHDFDQVDLLELWGLAGVLPDQGAPVEHVPACAIPPDQFVGPTGGTFHEEVAQLVMAMEHSALLIQDTWYEWALEGRIGQVEVDQSVNVVGLGSSIPLIVDELGIRLGCRI